MAPLILTFCFRDWETVIFNNFPSYKLNEILDFQYSMLKYRNMQINDDQYFSEFLYLHNLLQKDIKDKEVDPYPYKIMLHPAKGN